MSNNLPELSKIVHEGKLIPIDFNSATTSNVYCDNMKLKKLLLRHNPIVENLFSHEIAMLVETTFKQYTTLSRYFSSREWKSQWYVEYPEFLFYSLVNRGYIRECTDDEFMECCNRTDLYNLLTAKGIEPPINEMKSLTIAKEIYTGTEAVKKLGFRYFVLSDKGKKIMKCLPQGNVRKNILAPLIEYWNCPSKMPKDMFPMCYNPFSKKLSESEIKIVDTTIFELDICHPSYEGNLYLASVNPKIKISPKWSDTDKNIYEFKKESEVSVFCNGSILRLNNITHIILLSNLRKLIYGTKSSDGKIVACTCIDLLTREKIFDEKLPAKEIGEVTTWSEHNKEIKDYFPDTIDGIICDDYVNYYLSPTNELADLIINFHFANKYSVQKLPSLIKKDISTNYCISVPVDDVEFQRFLMFLIMDRKLTEPQIMGVKIYDILQDLTKRSKYRIKQMIIDNKELSKEPAKLVANDIMLEYDDNSTAFIDAVKKIYPNRILQLYPFCGYTAKRCGRGRRSKDKNFEYACSHRDKYKKQYDVILLSMKEKGIIKSKWRNEFALYLLIKSYYEDALYQHRVEWLGLQSLDIFIPSLNLAFEYQGVQHYKPVELFGGEEKFKETVERDKRKKILCDENNVRLIYWKFDEPIEDIILSQKLEEFRIELPDKKSFDKLNIMDLKANSSSKLNKNGVYKYDNQFNLVGTFRTIKEAAEATGISGTSIHKAIHGKRLRAGGFFWYKGNKPLEVIPARWKEITDEERQKCEIEEQLEEIMALYQQIEELGTEHIEAGFSTSTSKKSVS